MKDRKKWLEDFHRSWNGLNTAYERYAKSLGISFFSLQVICKICSAKNPVTQKDICEVAHLPKTTVHAIISGMIDRGYVELKKSDKDRRNKVICLTDSGRAYCTPIMKRMSDAEQAAFNRLDEGMMLAMLKGVEQYQKNLDANLNQGGNQ